MQAGNTTSQQNTFVHMHLYAYAWHQCRVSNEFHRRNAQVSCSNAQLFSGMECSKEYGANLVQAGALSFVLAELLHLVAVHGVAAGVRCRLQAVTEQEMY